MQQDIKKSRTETGLALFGQGADRAEFLRVFRPSVLEGDELGLGGACVQSIANGIPPTIIDTLEFGERKDVEGKKRNAEHEIYRQAALFRLRFEHRVTDITVVSIAYAKNKGGRDTVEKASVLQFINNESSDDSDIDEDQVRFPTSIPDEIVHMMDEVSKARSLFSILQHCDSSWQRLVSVTIHGVIAMPCVFIYSFPLALPCFGVVALRGKAELTCS
jgi:hypothetical protein